MVPKGEFKDITTAKGVIIDVFNPLKGDRSDVTNMAIVITDGMPNYPTWQTGNVSVVLQILGVKMFVVCVRLGCDESCAKGIATSPKAVSYTMNVTFQLRRVFDSSLQVQRQHLKVL